MKQTVFGPLGLLLILFVPIAGCSQQERSDVARNPASDTQASQRKPGGPLWNVEYIGGVLEAYKYTTFEVPAHGEINIGGWAVDQEAKLGAGGVEIRVDGVSYPAEYGQQRPDVARALNQPAYATAGYLIKLPAEKFSAGPHTAYFRVFSNDRKAYWEAGPYTITFK